MLERIIMWALWIIIIELFAIAIMVYIDIKKEIKRGRNGR